MSVSDPILVFEGVAKSYGSTTVLRDLDLAVPAGALTVVYGPPAAGKSVLMRVLMGLEEPTAGRVLLRGEDVTRLPAAERNIGYVPQSFALYPHLSVHDNIAYPLKLAGVGVREAEPVVLRAAEMLRIGDLLGKRPDQLSGGQKQRVAIARGIAKRSDLYVLDDPLAGLDFKLREQLVEDLRRLQAETRATFLYTTSDAIEALTLADRLAVLDGGRIVEAGEPERLYRDPTHARTMALVGFPPANFLPGSLERHDGGLVCRTTLFHLPVRLESRVNDVVGAVAVGIRPEDLGIGATDGVGASATNGRAAGYLRVPARVTLREDLGGEEIVYLDCGGTALTGVDRHHAHRAEFDEQTTLTIRSRDLMLFRATGERIGRGADGTITNGGERPPA